MEPPKRCAGECVSMSCDITSMFPHQLQPGLGLWTEEELPGCMCPISVSFILEGLVSVTHSYCVVLFCSLVSFAHFTFLVFVWSHRENRTQISNDPVCESVTTRRLCFEKVLYRSSPRPLFFFSPNVIQQAAHFCSALRSDLPPTQWLTAKNLLWINGMIKKPLKE